MLKQIHTGHAGVTKSLARARRSLYWYGQSNDVRNYVESCTVCQQTQRANSREPMILKTIPEYPFQTVSTDIFTFKGDDFILIADHYSGFMDFRKLKSSTSAEVILYLRTWFGVHGIPEILESDGGPQYSSKKFADFAKRWNFQHQMSSPYYPRSNGFAERNVQTAKNLLKRCYLDGTDLYLALLLLRNTPRNEVLQSPNQRLFSRLTRTTLPIERNELKPKVVEGVSKELSNLRLQQKNYADKASVPLEKLKVGNNIRLRVAHREWKGAKVIEETKYPRSVLVETTEGKVYRRNTQHLHKTKGNIPPSNDNDLQYGSQTEEILTPTQLKNDTNMQTLDDMNQPQNDSIILPTSVIPNPDILDARAHTPNRTRSGRIIKKPVKFDPSDV